ncbi:hypothetical protein [Variovorax gossypii]
MEKTRKYSKIPSAADLAAFGGMHCSRIHHEAVASGWRCPSCNRNANEVVRWTEIKGAWREKFADEFGMGFTTSLTHHHCHSELQLPRFQRALICGDCNSADAAAKRKLGLPADWSFSPAELAQFVRVAPHSGKTMIDYAIARVIFDTTQRSSGNVRFWD